MSEEREWWQRVLAVPVRPRVAFAGLRDDRPEAVEARQEPILAVILFAGVAGILATPAWHTLMDDVERDALVVAVLTFIGGSLYGAAGYWIVGGALYLALRGLGSAASDSPPQWARLVRTLRCGGPPTRRSRCSDRASPRRCIGRRRVSTRRVSPPSKCGATARTRLGVYPPDAAGWRVPSSPVQDDRATSSMPVR